MRIMSLLLSALLFLILIDACFKYLPPIKLPRMMQHKSIRDALISECSHEHEVNGKKVKKNECIKNVMKIPIMQCGVNCRDLQNIGMYITCWDPVQGGGTSWE